MEFKGKPLESNQTNLQAKQFKWVRSGRKWRSDCLSEEVIERVVDFWTGNTSVSPNKKDVFRQ